MVTVTVTAILGNAYPGRLFMGDWLRIYGPFLRELYDISNRLMIFLDHIG